MFIPRFSDLDTIPKSPFIHVTASSALTVTIEAMELITKFMIIVRSTIVRIVLT